MAESCLHVVHVLRLARACHLRQGPSRFLGRAQFHNRRICDAALRQARAGDQPGFLPRGIEQVEKNEGKVQLVVRKRLRGERASFLYRLRVTSAGA